MTREANNLYSATIFHERQCFFGLKKEPAKRYDLENQVMNSIASNLEAMNAPRLKKNGIPKKVRTSEEPKEGEPEEPEKAKWKKKKDGPRFELPTAQHTFLTSGFLCELFRVTGNPDCTAAHLGRQTAQNVVEEAAGQFSNCFSNLRTTGRTVPPTRGCPSRPGT